MGLKEFRGAGGKLARLSKEIGLASLLALATVLLCQCTAAQYGKKADNETSYILAAKAGDVPNVEPDFSIEPPEPISLKELEENAKAVDFLGEAVNAEKGAKVVTLADSLGLAIKYNRRYLSRKESIYLQALNLTLVRHELAPIFSGEVDLTRSHGTSGGSSSRGSSSSNLTAASVQSGVDRIVAENTFARNSSLGFSMLQRTGARVAADFTTDFLNFLGGDRSINSSQLAVTLTQPLLKGGGYRVTLENLTQAERNLLYELRDFANFRREFVVEIASRYYDVLRARDRVKNNWIGYQGFRLAVEREEALAEEDRRTQTELGQLRQAELRSESDWVDAVRDYEQQLDELKIELGLPVDEKIVLEERELERLEIEDPNVSREQAVTLAVSTRPDLVTSEDQVADAVRKIEVAKVDLRPGLDVVAAYDINSRAGDGTPALDFDRRNWSAGLEVDLPFDRKEERNNYRSALIALEQAKRDRELDFDQVRLQIYNDWRTLEQARRNHEISVLGVELAERRLEEQKLRSDLGEGEARDLIDAQRDLIDSRNQRTSAIVDHTLSRLRLWQDMGILYINKDGSWVKQLEKEASE